MELKGNIFKLESHEIKALPDYTLEFPAKEAQERSTSLLKRAQEMEAESKQFAESPIMGNKAYARELEHKARIVRSMSSQLSAYAKTVIKQLSLEDELEEFLKEN